ncbi:MAG: hypothetical protein BWX48_01519 [Verrucomicrobia bacterium ADurb.Bin006]|jgi:hypothetical protein|nr:MAG: hypothetical protein BWX48_01519 [Verrucomicrobia bacterium ADurb.Bin006]
MAMANRIWEGERPGTFRLPENPWLVQLFVLALRSYNFPFLGGQGGVLILLPASLCRWPTR